MCFEIRRVCQTKARILVRPLDQILLRRPRGQSETGSIPILVASRVADDGPNNVPVSNSFLQGLKHKKRTPFTASIAVSLFVKGLRLAIGGDEVKTGHERIGLGGTHHIDPSHK